ncbi:MAG: L-aspartate oxidase, partial [Nitratireductor sp.]
ALQELRGAMSERCGVVRDAAGMTRVLDLIDRLQTIHGAARALATARLIVQAALNRKESRGGHFRSDYPDMIAPERQFLLRDFEETART